MRFCCTALILSLAAAGRLDAQQDARQIIHQVLATYQAAKSFHFESVTDGDVSGEIHHSWSRSRDTLAKDQPDKVRWESIAMGGSFVVVSDGKAAWIASPDSREFIRMAVTGPLLEMKGGGPVAQTSLGALKWVQSEFERLEVNLRKAEQIGNETVEVGGKAIECAVVRADYEPPKGAFAIDSTTRSFWIDTRRNLILREEIVVRGKLFPSRPYEDVVDRQSRRYIVASVNEPLPDSLFVYTPPKSFSEVDKLERAFPRPATELKGKQAPDLSLQSLAGDTIRLADLRGKIVLLDFWATWCGPCRDQMPVIAKLHHETRDQGVVLLGVNGDETPDAAVKFLRERGYEWTNLYDGKQKEAQGKLKVTAIPALVLIDRQH